jgi:hypothetical protein
LFFIFKNLPNSAADVPCISIQAAGFRKLLTFFRVDSPSSDCILLFSSAIPNVSYNLKSDKGFVCNYKKLPNLAACVPRISIRADGFRMLLTFFRVDSPSSDCILLFSSAIPNVSYHLNYDDGFVSNFKNLPNSATVESRISLRVDGIS